MRSNRSFGVAPIFAGNFVLFRIAVKGTGIDAASFTSIRLVSRSGALDDHDFSALQSFNCSATSLTD